MRLRPGAAAAATLLYVTVAGGWILVSDALVAASRAPPVVHTWKGVAFVAFTAAMLYVLVHRHVRAVDRYASRVRALAAQVLEAQESERARLARDLHDELGQRLTLAKIALDPSGAGARDERTAFRVVDEALQLVRRLTLDLRPPLLDTVGLRGALAWMLEQTVGQTAGVTWSLEGAEPVRLDPREEIVLYRVAQEAVTNALRHARPTRVVVRLDVDAEAVELCVEDDGSGVAPPPPGARPSGVGLVGARERLATVGGTLRVDGARGRGTRLVARIPRG